MALTIKETELVNFGASIAAGCKPCTSYHFRKVKEAGASNEEIKNVIEDSINIRELAKKEMENHAKSLIGVPEQPYIKKDIPNSDRVKVLVSIGAAFAVNCTSTLNNFIALSESVGITTEDIIIIFRSATLVKRKAALYVEKIALRLKEFKSVSRDNDQGGCDCSESAGEFQNKLEDDVEKGCC
jgi:AhpD family alkylhydroperoxidase